MEIDKKNFAQVFANKAMQWLNVPYRHRGATKRGCDCIGLIIGIVRELGFLEDYKIPDYSEQWSLHSAANNQLIRNLESFCNVVDSLKIKRGDIAVMKMGRCIAHCGIIIDATKKLMIHTNKLSGKTHISRLKNSIWQKRWEKTYRIDYDKLSIA